MQGPLHVEFKYWAGDYGGLRGLLHADCNLLAVGCGVLRETTGPLHVGFDNVSVIYVYLL